MSYSIDKQMKRTKRNLIFSIIGFVIMVILLISRFNAMERVRATGSFDDVVNGFGNAIGFLFLLVIAFFLLVRIIINQSEISRLKNLGKGSSGYSGISGMGSSYWSNRDKSTRWENMGRDR